MRGHAVAVDAPGETDVALLAPHRGPRVANDPVVARLRVGAVAHDDDRVVRLDLVAPGLQHAALVGLPRRCGVDADHHRPVLGHVRGDVGLVVGQVLVPDEVVLELRRGRGSM